MVELTTKWGRLNTTLVIESENEKRANRLCIAIGGRIGRALDDRRSWGKKGEPGNGLEREISRVYSDSVEDQNVQVTVTVDRTDFSHREGEEHSERVLDAGISVFDDIIETVFDEYTDERTILAPSGEWESDEEVAT